MNKAEQHQENAREHSKAAVRNATKDNWDRAAVFAQLAQAEATMAQNEILFHAIHLVEWR